jgi:hypothetical protein
MRAVKYADADELRIRFAALAVRVQREVDLWKLVKALEHDGCHACPLSAAPFPLACAIADAIERAA